MNQQLPRRGVLAGAAFSALSYQRILGANDRVGVGLIGCGSRGIRALLKDALEFREQANVHFPAVCDIWRQHREEAAAEIKTKASGDAKQLGAYRELLAMKEIDAVIIATPDHQHATMLTDAVRAGKDAYCEKPLAMEMKELLLCVDTVRKSDRVVQMGTQVRSLPSSMAARKFVTAGGMGKVFKIEQERNSVKPYWFNYGERTLQPDDTNWKAFLFNRKDRPWDAKQHAGWFGYREFSRGPHSNLMVHFIDLVHHITGVTMPKRCVTLGGSFRYKDEYTAPDSVETILEYDGFLVRYSSAFGTSAGNYLKFFGTKATLDASNWNGKPFVLETRGAEEPLPAGASIPEMESDNHMLNWLKCLRSRQQPNAPIDSGYSHSVAVILSDEALIRGRRVVFDPVKRAIREG
ncbi:MAG: Gfo/Idh/MocA family oxidoreductase [Candidatus Solibacter usitatus]|nr:Gfo/Idh/MocA family oxidoreductase [Candidatus Solibacter usitatus]